MSSTIHPTAIISDSASIDDGVVIGPYAVIGDNVTIGSGTRIDSHVVINGPTTIGNDNHIYQFCSVGDDPQDKKYRDEPTRLVIGNGNTIREFCTISRGTIQDEGARFGLNQGADSEYNDSLLRSIWGMSAYRWEGHP